MTPEEAGAIYEAARARASAWRWSRRSESATLRWIARVIGRRRQSQPRHPGGRAKSQP